MLPRPGPLEPITPRRPSGSDTHETSGGRASAARSRVLSVCTPAREQVCVYRAEVDFPAGWADGELTLARPCAGVRGTSFVAGCGGVRVAWGASACGCHLFGSREIDSITRFRVTVLA